LREIKRKDGSVYLYVIVEDGKLRLKPNSGTAKGIEIVMDAKVIPELRQILTEAEILKYI
jgi:hypothetical protein